MRKMRSIEHGEHRFTHLTPGLLNLGRLRGGRAAILCFYQTQLEATPRVGDTRAWCLHPERGIRQAQAGGSTEACAARRFAERH